jgi:hypothetical protein
MEKANYDTVFSFASNLATRINSLGLSQERLDGIKRGAYPEFWTTFDTLMCGGQVVITDVERWQGFYKKFFNRDFDFSGVQIPERVEDFNRLIIIPGLSLEEVWTVHKRHFFCEKYTCSKLDDTIVYNDRNVAGGAYAIWVRDRVEADKETQGLSEDNLARQGLKGITLLERLIFGLKYFSETKKHLDQNGIVTVCSGSRDQDGYVPDVRWDDGERVYINGSGCRHVYMRPRVVITV